MELEHRLWIFTLSLILISGSLILWGGNSSPRPLIRPCVCDVRHRYHRLDQRSGLVELLYRFVSGSQQRGDDTGNHYPEHDGLCYGLRVGLY
jgi:hypothetical protein